MTTIMEEMGEIQKMADDLAKEMYIEVPKVEEPPVVQVMCDSCHEMEDEDQAHSYGDATFCDSCYEGCIA